MHDPSDTLPTLSTHDYDINITGELVTATIGDVVVLVKGQEVTLLKRDLARAVLAYVRGRDEQARREELTALACGDAQRSAYPGEAMSTGAMARANYAGLAEHGAFNEAAIRGLR